MLFKKSKTIKRIRKTTCVTKDDITVTNGKICDGKIVFLIKFALPMTAPDALLSTSANRFQIAMPAVNQTTNGTSFTGWTLNPTLNTNQNTPIMTIGLINVQTKPSKEPTC